MRHRAGGSRSLGERLRAGGRALGRELAVYRRVARHPRTPLAARLLLLAAIGYTLMPFDLVPDFLPVVGQLDDLVVVPALFLLARRLVPDDVVAECRGGLDTIRA